MTRFVRKVALVTGAGSGIGRAVAQRLASEGARVLAHDRDAAGLDATAAGAAAAAAADVGAGAPAGATAAGGAVVTRTGDLLARDECVAAVAACVDTFGRLDVLVNVAGIARAEHAVDVTEASYRQMMGVNTDAVFFLCQAAIPHLLEAHGNIVTIASNAGLMGQAYTVVYCMSKGAVVQLTRALAMEYAKAPLRVNCIAPAGTTTNLVHTYEMPADVDLDLVGRYVGHRGLGEPEDVAGLVAYVASEDGRRIHGAVLPIDGGVTAG